MIGMHRDRLGVGLMWLLFRRRRNNIGPCQHQQTRKTSRGLDTYDKTTSYAFSLFIHLMSTHAALVLYLVLPIATRDSRRQHPILANTRPSR